MGVDGWLQTINTRRIGDLAVFGGDIKVGAQQYAFVFKIKIANGFEIHY